MACVACWCGMEAGWSPRGSRNTAVGLECARGKIAN